MGENNFNGTGTNSVGIVAEYNPFHNGHAYQLKRAKELSGGGTAVVAMSQECLQRGAFSPFDKFWRARKAIESGADLVVGLPYPVAGQSAERFAGGAVRILSEIGVDSLSFGVESDSPGDLFRLASILAQEPEEFKVELRRLLKAGVSYPRARQLAVEAVTGQEAGGLASPNNTLAVEYIKAAMTLGADLEFHPVKRVGRGYHDRGAGGTFPSATGIREALDLGDWEAAKQGIPYEIGDLREAYNPFREDLFFASLKTKLLGMTPEDLSLIEGVNDDLANKMLKHIGPSFSLRDFLEKLKSKNLTHSSLTRALMNVMLELKKSDVDLYFSEDYTPYIRVLGFSPKGRELLKNIKAPILSVPSKDIAKLSPEQKNFFLKDLHAANFRSIFLDLKEYNNDYYQKPIILKN